MSKTELTEFAGALYLSYEALAARIATLDGDPAGSVMQDALETVDEQQLTEAGEEGRSKSMLNATELTEWSGATEAVYASLEARMTAVESAT